MTPYMKKDDLLCHQFQLFANIFYIRLQKINIYIFYLLMVSPYMDNMVHFNMRF